MNFDVANVFASEDSNLNCKIKYVRTLSHKGPYPRFEIGVTNKGFYSDLIDV